MSEFKVGDRVIHTSTGIKSVVTNVGYNDFQIDIRPEGEDTGLRGVPVAKKHVRHLDETPDAPAAPDPGVELNPRDPFESVLIDIVKTNRRKRADYAVDGSPWSNFDDTANSLGIDGFDPVDSANFNVEQKSARLRSLRKNGRMSDPENESVADTYLDRAVYSIIAYGIHRYPSGKVEQ